VAPAEPNRFFPGEGFGPARARTRGIDKRFGVVHANRAVSLAVARGTIHGLVGENGAGKSTLMNIVYGFHRADAGEILIHGRRVEIHRPHDAIAAGVGMVHQHFMLVENFTVLENVILGVEGGRRLADGMARARAELEEIARTYGLDVPLDTPVGQLPVGLQTARGDPEGALPARGHPDPRRANGRADAARGGPAFCVAWPGCARRARR